MQARFQTLLFILASASAVIAAPIAQAGEVGRTAPADLASGSPAQLPPVGSPANLASGSTPELPETDAANLVNGAPKLPEVGSPGNPISAGSIPKLPAIPETGAANTGAVTGLVGGVLEKVPVVGPLVNSVLGTAKGLVPKVNGDTVDNTLTGATDKVKGVAGDVPVAGSVAPAVVSTATGATDTVTDVADSEVNTVKGAAGAGLS